jgi:uncharacterized DUF497 family protein
VKRVDVHRENIAKHDVDREEVGEVLRDGWGRRRRDGENYEVLGRTLAGRYLQLVVEDLPDRLRVFHAREMTQTERRRYERK